METIFLKRRELFVANLSVLGFDTFCIENKCSSILHRDMFSVSNKTAFEFVTYFLFGKLNEVTCDPFKFVWPIYDRKMAQEFRKKVYDYLVAISKNSDNNGIKFPRLYPTLLITPGGDRFYELYLSFSAYVLQKHIEYDKIYQTPSFKSFENKKHQGIREKSLKTTITLRTHDFIDTQQNSVKHYEHYEKIAGSFEEYYRYIKDRILQLTLETKETVDTLYHLYSENTDEAVTDETLKKDYLISKKDEKFQLVFSMWKEIENNLQKEKVFWDIVSSEIDADCNAKKEILRGQEYVINMPEILTTKYNHELREKKVQCLVDNGMLSVKNFLNLWAVTINCYTDLFNDKGTLLESLFESAILNNEIESLRDYLNNIKLLNQKLTELLREEIDKIDTLEDKMLYSKSCTNDLSIVGFPPITPPFTFSPKISRNSSMILPENYLYLTPNTGKLSLMKKKIEDLHSMSPLHFSFSNFQNSSFENRGHMHVKSVSNSILNKSSTTSDNNSPSLNLHNNSLIRELREASKPIDLFTSCFSEERSFPDDVTSIDSSRSKFEISPLADGSVTERVSQEFGNLSISFKEGERNNRRKSLNYVGILPTSNEDKAFMSPISTSFTFDMDSVEKLAKLSQHLHLEKEGDYISKNYDRYNFGHISFSEDEMLDDMTLPPIPFF